MLKNMAFYIIICLLACGAFLTLLPYPTFSSGTYNISKSDMAKINKDAEQEKYLEDIQEKHENKLIQLDWQSVDALLGCYSPINVLDMQGKQYKIIRIGGFLHADIRPYDTSDTLLVSSENATIPILVEIKPEVWTAASLSSVPRGESTLPHYCLYFAHSKAHCTNQEDCVHQKTILFANKHGQQVLNNYL